MKDLKNLKKNQLIRLILILLIPANIYSLSDISDIQNAFEMRMNGDCRQAEIILQQALSNEESALVHYELFRIYFYTFPRQKNAYQKADEQIKKALHLNQNCPEYLEAAGFLKIYQGVWQFKKIWAIPFSVFHFIQSGQYFEEAGRLYLNQQRTNDSCRAYLHAVEIYANAPFFLGGNQKKAVKLQESIALMDPVRGLEASLLLEKENHPELIIDECRKLESEYGFDPGINQMKAHEFLDLKNGFQKSVELIEEAVLSNQKYVDQYYRLYLDRFEEKDYRNAEIFIKKYLESMTNCKPLTAHAMMHLSRIYRLQNKSGLKEKYQNLAHEADPDYWTSTVPPPEILFRSLPDCR